MGDRLVHRRRNAAGAGHRSAAGRLPGHGRTGRRASPAPLAHGAIVGTSIGTVASIVPLVIASFPFVSRLVETSMREVDAGVIEAAQSMGATPLQIITKVMVPESMPSLVANVTIAATTIMGYGAMAGIIGGGGLGKIAINYGYYRFNVVLEFFATALLVVLVQILQTVGTKLAIKCDKRIQK